MQKFTPEDLLLFIYGEMPVVTQSQVCKALENDWTLREKYKVLEEATKRLNKLTVSPRPKSIASIMQYAADKLQPLEHS